MIVNRLVCGVLILDRVKDTSQNTRNLLIILLVPSENLAKNGNTAQQLIILISEFGR